MKDITDIFGKQYLPKSALVFYHESKDTNDGFIEYYDISKTGNPINAHPITVNETKKLAQAFKLEETDRFLDSSGLIPDNILSISFETKRVVWFSKSSCRNLLFTDGLGIKSDIAIIPPLVWSADKDNLSVYALKSNRRPTEKTVLYHAPFFNIYGSGLVCMGTVDINISESTSLKEFINAWENYFFNSYFSHLMGEHNPIDGNLISIWKETMENSKSFPINLLVKNGKTIKNLCYEKE